MNSVAIANAALLQETLDLVGWVIARANCAVAKLGLARTTLIAKMKRLGISKRERFGISESQKKRGPPHFTLT